MMRRRRPVKPRNALASAKAKLALEAEAFRRKAFLALLRDRGLPEPECEVEFCLPDRRFRLDFYWRTHRLALESDGGSWSGGRHQRGQGANDDMDKANEAVLRGILIMHRPSDKLATDDTCNLVKRALHAIHNRED